MNALRAAWVDAVSRALAEDLGQLGDLTVQAVIDPEAMGRGRFVARRAGCLAGLDAIDETFAQVDPTVRVDRHVEDGSLLEPGTTVATISGPYGSLLIGERTALNLLCHLSGIATLTARFVDAVSSVGSKTVVLDTRKTLPGLRALQKYAVRTGGGRNHRESLSDAIMIKDNHLRAIGSDSAPRAGSSLSEAVARARAMWPGRAVEVECDSLELVGEAKAVAADIVMCDNMPPAMVREAIELLDGRALVEVSGGIDLESIAEYARAGADFISIGALTHSAPALDLGLDFD